MNDEQRDEILRRHAVALSEHFSSVQIIAVRHLDDEDGGYVRFTYGKGSYYERIGATTEFLDAERASTRARSAQRALEDDDEEGDSDACGEAL